MVGLDPQTECVGGPDESLQTQCMASFDDLVNLLLGDDLGQRFDVIEFSSGRELPSPAGSWFERRT